MKPNFSLLKSLTLFTLTVGSLGGLYSNEAQGQVTQINPKVTICYQNRTILVATTTAQALIAANQATAGACTNVVSVAMCYNGRNIQVSPAVVNAMLSAGATLGSCSPSLVGSGDGKSTAPSATSPATSGVVSSVTPSTAPAAPVLPAFITPAVGRPNSPVQINEIDVCYKGHTLSVMPTAVQTYLSIGGTLGPCSKVSLKKTEKTDSDELQALKNTLEAVEETKQENLQK